MKIFRIYILLLINLVIATMISSIFSENTFINNKQQQMKRLFFHGEKTGIIPPQKENFSLPDDVLAFPEFSNDYEKKIISSGNYKIITEEKVLDWAKAQGFTSSKDSIAGGNYYKRSAVIHPPGIKFFLKIPKNDYNIKQSKFAWYLHLDISMPKIDHSKRILTTSYYSYNNILRYHIYIDNIFYKTVEVGYGVTQKTPLVFFIPFIRDPEGKIIVDIRLANRPNQVLMLYDAFLSKKSN